MLHNMTMKKKKNDITKQQEDEFFPSDEILEEEILDLNQYFESFFKEENIESLIAVI